MYCLISEFIVGRLLSLIEKIISLVMWWFVRMKMEKITDLVEQLENLKKRVDFQESQKIMKISKISVAVVIMVMCLVPAIRTLYYTLSSNDRYSCISKMMYNLKTVGLISSFIYELTNTYVYTVPSYAVCVFYTIYCKTFSVLLHDNQFSASQAVQVKTKCVEIFKNFENTFSFLILVVFTFLLCSFFKIIFLFAYGIKIASYPLNYLYLIDFTSHSVLVIAMVLSADDIQERVTHINLMFSTQPNNEMDFSKQYLDILRNRASLSLTGWGMFTVRKPLLLSMLAWLFTYAVIILQFFYTPSN
ncbi:uncharacterized protein CDAR_370551 [Caerostris darwini]|uniref:Gustatory receptor n=1 Tax=Caerostris darwini TaxID=1538125 RepID=A0AAV4VEF4_9ARAC|nr:uncharacterized protein CDAR_370551 [Caerostris darwini]